MPRFFVQNVGDCERIELPEHEAHHLVHVLRLKAGEQVTLFDGTGTEYAATVSAIERGRVVVQVGERRDVCRELPIELTLACPAPAGERLRWLIEKATELGVSKFQPLVTAHSTPRAGNLSAEKLKRWVIEASKQCGRNVLMNVAGPVPWHQFAGTVHADTVRLIAHSEGLPWRKLEPIRAPQAVAVAVGPEGGWTEEELALAQRHGWTKVSLGPRTLRVETAAIALAACIAASC
jgi:16S rRNA (uracil1498-N3)-methyltransferase